MNAASAASFNEYPVKRWSGKTVKPDFKGAQKDFSRHRTRITEDGVKKRPDFAGSWTVVQYGCGSSCSVTVLFDHKTGNILRVPIGGEDQQNVFLYHNVNSRLLKVTWFDGVWFDENSACMIGEFVLDGNKLVQISTKKHTPRDDCKSGPN